MHNIIKLDSIQITYAGKVFGNMDFNHGSKKEVNSNHQKLLQILKSNCVVDIRSKGGNTFVDVDTKSLKQHFNFIACDGLITSNKEVALTLFPADCIPLVIYSPNSETRALLHVGRRGAETNLIEDAINYIVKNKHIDIKKLFFYFGPSVSKDSYYFETIDVDQLKSASWYGFIENKKGYYHIDLVGFVTNRLKRLGVKKKQIKYSGINVGDTESEYFSHVRSKRSGEPEGRNLFAVESLK